MVGTPRLVTRSGSGYVLHIGKDERQVVIGLLEELRTMQTDPAAGEATARLFPVVHPDDPDQEAEYQRLMRDELVQSKLEAIARVESVLNAERRSDRVVDEIGLVAFMQSLNAIRLVLGTMLGVTDDPSQDEVDEQLERSPEYHLYAYLSWLLEHCVRAVSGE